MTIMLFMIENDIYDLQVKISFLEGFMKDLNTVVIEQNKDNMTLNREIVLLKDKIEQLEDRLNSKGGEDIADDVPPHY